MTDINIEVEGEEKKTVEAADDAAKIVGAAIEIAEKIEDAKQSDKFDLAEINRRFDGVERSIADVLSRLDVMLIAIGEMQYRAAEVIADAVDDLEEAVVETAVDTVETVEEAVEDFETIPEEEVVVEVPETRKKRIRRFI